MLDKARNKVKTLEKEKEKKIFTKKEKDEDIKLKPPSYKEKGKEKEKNDIKIQIMTKQPNLKIVNNILIGEEINTYMFSDYQIYKVILTNLEELNINISTYLLKKKINVKEIEIKLKNEEDRKEKEALTIRKNLETKIDSVLNKASLCLDNIKQMGKKGVPTTHNPHLKDKNRDDTLSKEYNTYLI